MKSSKTTWEPWFAWLDGEHPLSDNVKPLADFECRTCGLLDCTDEHEDNDQSEAQHGREV